jgi:hypothetical protein
MRYIAGTGLLHPSMGLLATDSTPRLPAGRTGEGGAASSTGTSMKVTVRAGVPSDSSVERQAPMGDGYRRGCPAWNQTP